MNINFEDFTKLIVGANGYFSVGQNGVNQILLSQDKKVEFIFFDSHTLAFVRSALGYPAFYPVLPVKIEKPVKAVLMDLDGTSVRSEDFWIWIIEQSTANLLDNPNFQLEDADLPFVSGHSVSEHLEYCIQKYCPDKSLEEAKSHYFRNTRREMKEILDGRGKENAFVPVEGLKDFLYALKDRKIKIGLVTSGLYEKAWPEILAAFRTLKMGDPAEFYDAIVSAGFPLQKGAPGTLGELQAKPHPWLYAETAKVGLGIDFSDRHSVVGMEDSGAGVCSVRLAGFSCLGMAGGNIKQSGLESLCSDFCDNFDEVINKLT